MPEHSDITDLLSGTNINFFHCVKIVEILKETEKDSKNFLGQYGSQRMTDWKEILGLYEKENILLGGLLFPCRRSYQRVLDSNY